MDITAGVIPSGIITGCQHWTLNGVNCANCGELIPEKYKDKLITGVVMNQLNEPKINMYGTDLSKSELDMLLVVFRNRVDQYKPHRKYH